MKNKRYRLRVWCPDCLYIDNQGCFDGDYADLGDDEYHDTLEQAEAVGMDWMKGTIWEFSVIDTETGLSVGP